MDISPPEKQSLLETFDVSKRIDKLLRELAQQIEVLRPAAPGLSNRNIAERLVISPRTAEHHVQDVYARIGASTRAAAALFAMEHGLLGPREGSKIGRSTQAGG